MGSEWECDAVCERGPRPRGANRRVWEARTPRGWEIERTWRATASGSEGWTLTKLWCPITSILWENEKNRFVETLFVSQWPRRSRALGILGKSSCPSDNWESGWSAPGRRGRKINGTDGKTEPFFFKFHKAVITKPRLALVKGRKKQQQQRTAGWIALVVMAIISPGNRMQPDSHGDRRASGRKTGKGTVTSTLS